MRSVKSRVRNALSASLTAAFLLFVSGALADTAHATAQTPRTKTVWVQTMDSCQEAVPGATFALTGNGLSLTAGPGQGVKVVTVARVQGHCPLQRGNCARISTGCVAFHVPVPSSGFATYTIRMIQPTRGFQPCNGSTAACFEFVTLKISSHGVVTAWVTNHFWAGRTVTWPTTGKPYSGSMTDPIVFHSGGRFVGL